MRNNILIYIAILCAIVACKPHKNLVSTSSINDTTVETVTRIEFGSGGGFANAHNSYTLCSDGTLLEGNNKIKQFPVDSISFAFDLADSIKSSYVAPGNTYQFVNIYHPSDSVFCSWQYGDKKVKSEIIVLYNKLRELL